MKDKPIEIEFNVYYNCTKYILNSTNFEIINNRYTEE
jgi:hypothetical protein